MKKAFTLGEMITTMCVIGVIAAILYPMLKNIKLNENNRMFEKAYFKTEEIVGKLVNDQRLYPKPTEKKERYGLGNLRSIKYRDQEYGNNEKLCGLFAAQLGIERKNTNCKSQKFTKGEPPVGSFTTSDGVTWILPVSNFGIIKNPKKLFVDVNGEKGPNSFTKDENTGKDADRFGILIYPDGQVMRDPNPEEPEIPDEEVKDDGIEGGFTLPEKIENQEPDLSQEPFNPDQLNTSHMKRNNCLGKNPVYSNEYWVDVHHRDNDIPKCQMFGPKAKNRWVAVNGALEEADKWMRNHGYDKDLKEQTLAQIEETLLALSLREGKPSYKKLHDEFEEIFDKAYKEAYYRYYGGETISDNLQQILFSKHIVGGRGKHGGHRAYARMNHDKMLEFFTHDILNKRINQRLYDYGIQDADHETPIHSGGNNSDPREDEYNEQGGSNNHNGPQGYEGMQNYY